MDDYGRLPLEGVTPDSPQRVLAQSSGVYLVMQQAFSAASNAFH